MQKVLGTSFIFLLGAVLLLVACAQPEATRTPTLALPITATPAPTTASTKVPAPTATLAPAAIPTYIATPASIPTPSPAPKPLPSETVAAPTLTASTLATLPTVAATPPPTTVFQPQARPIRSRRIFVTTESLWAGHPASRTVTRLALPSGKQVWQSDIGCEPATLSRAEHRLFVACFDSGEVLVLDDMDGDILARRLGGPWAFWRAGRWRALVCDASTR